MSRPELLNLKVLIVDDDDDGRFLLANVLERCGTVVISAQSGAEAMEKLLVEKLLVEKLLVEKLLVEKLLVEKPDVIISDIAMPGEDGYALIRKIRGLPADRGGDIPAAALTA